MAPKTPGCCRRRACAVAGVGKAVSTESSLAAQSRGLRVDEGLFRARGTVVETGDEDIMQHGGGSLLANIFKHHGRQSVQRYHQDADIAEYEINHYLDKMSTGQLQEEERYQLVAAVTTNEIAVALNSLTSGKAPGPDKIPLEFL
ncbi:hypothetical protein NDU88_004652 [Pleurodeles waltl]|uniref:Uncharacterized protein n=1 Tax=Pleurodeles waltl TaxID=8319 RepID=A0AAV7NLP1_PLEWA|nr:hypothetical protein NDU88_004652 [Pleurodeles waltl]